jgi:hypothetical protein
MNPNEPRIGTIYLKQVVLTEPATLPGHAVRYDDPIFSSLNPSNFLKAGYGAEIFKDGNTSTNGDAAVNNGYAFAIKPDSSIENGESMVNSLSVVGVKASNKYYFTGSIAKNFGAGLTPGASYWLQRSGPPALTTANTPSEWSILVGIALNTTDIIVLMQNMGRQPA